MWTGCFVDEVTKGKREEGTEEERNNLKITNNNTEERNKEDVNNEYE